MKTLNRLLLLTAFLLCAAPLRLLAVPVMSFDESRTAIFGSGNPDTGWTTSYDSSLNLAVSLRAKNRVTGSTANNGAGTYSYASAPATRGLWNYEFSLDSGFAPLSSYDFFLSVDRDSSQGVSYATINPLTHWFDNSFGTIATVNGQGTEGPSFLLAGSNTIAQNSQNITFGGLTGYPGGALVLEQNATYTYNLFATASGAGVGGTRLADTTINVVVGNGGEPAQNVPDTGGTLALIGLAFGGLVALRRRFADTGPLPAAA
jgi:hypothetical protein